MDKVYHMDDMLDGEFEYQTVREVLFDNRKNILTLCNNGYSFDNEVLERAGISFQEKVNFNSNVIHLSSNNPSLDDIINNRPAGYSELINAKNYLDNKHCPNSLSEEDELGYNLNIITSKNGMSLPQGEYAIEACEQGLFQYFTEKYDDDDSFYDF